MSASSGLGGDARGGAGDGAGEKAGARVLFYVQHLLGTGHLWRAAAIARALARAGMSVTVASGGFPVPGIDFGASVRVVQLPPARAADSGFRRLVDGNGQPVDEAWWRYRQACLLALAREVRPQVVLIESFPFGRRAFRHELLALLAATRDYALTAASVRDIIVVGRDPARQDETVASVRQWFDLVLVHGDPRLVALDRSFPAAGQIADRLIYTGYVVADRPRDGSGAEGGPSGDSNCNSSVDSGYDSGRDSSGGSSSDSGCADGRTGGDGVGEVIVSTGGGAVGGPLLRAALAARPLTALAGARWRFLLGADLPAAEAAALVAMADVPSVGPAGVPAGGSVGVPVGDGVRMTTGRVDASPHGGIVVSGPRADFPRLLARCALSISQAGYNTVLDVLVAGCRSVVVPFSGVDGKETEQPLRARLLAERGVLHWLHDSKLEPGTLARVIDAAWSGAPPAPPPLTLDGARVTAAAILGALHKKPA